MLFCHLSLSPAQGLSPSRCLVFSGRSPANRQPHERPRRFVTHIQKRKVTNNHHPCVCVCEYVRHTRANTQKSGIFVSAPIWLLTPGQIVLGNWFNLRAAFCVRESATWGDLRFRSPSGCSKRLRAARAPLKSARHPIWYYWISYMLSDLSRALVFSFNQTPNPCCKRIMNLRSFTSV